MIRAINFRFSTNRSTGYMYLQKLIFLKLIKGNDSLYTGHKLYF